MGYFLQQDIKLTLDCARAEDGAEMDTARLFAFMANLVKTIGQQHNSQLSLQTIGSISGLADEDGNLRIAWAKEDLFASFGLLAESVWHEIAGPSATITHTLNGEPAIAREPGSHGAGGYGSGPYGGTGGEAA